MMKLAVFTLVSVVLSRAIQTSANENGSIGKRHEERRSPKSDVELLYMMNHLTVILKNALNTEVSGASPERWHRAKMTLKLVEKSAKNWDAVLTAEEKSQINNEVNSINTYLVPLGDLKVKDKCDEGFEDTFCRYYNFTSYAEEVADLAKKAKSLNDNYRSKDVSDEKTRTELIDQLSSVRDEMEQIEAAPSYLWGNEPKFEETRNSLENSENLVSEVAIFLKVKMD